MESADSEHDLAACVPFLAFFEGAARFGEGKTLRGGGAHLPRVEQRADLAQLLRIGLDDEPDEAHPVSRRPLRGGRADDGDQHAPMFHHLPGAGQGLATHRVEHDIYITDYVLEARGGIVKNLVRSEVAQVVSMTSRCGRDNSRPCPA